MKPIQWSLVALAACSHRSEEETEGLRHISGSFTAPADGDTKVSFRVHDGETELMAIVQAEPERSTIAALDAPNGDRAFQADPSADHLSTNAGFVAPVSVLDWPVLSSDTPLSSGRWSATIGVVDENLHFIPGNFQFDVWLASAKPASDNTLKVTLHYAEGLEDNADLAAALYGDETGEGAIDHWRELYAPMGISLEVDEEELTGESPGLPGNPSQIWEELSSGEARRVNVVFVGNILGIPDAFGLAGGIPGPLGSTAISGVLVSATLSAGNDGAFDQEERRILGETLAHETGHYLGLFHPVEATWDQWDALGDTSECTDAESCLHDLGTNLMFPYPVCSFQACNPQSALTSDQEAVARRHPDVR
jgi:hypothetical protein